MKITLPLSADLTGEMMGYKKIPGLDLPWGLLLRAEEEEDGTLANACLDFCC